MKRHKHSLSHYRLTTFDQGYLYPVACLEVLPGDSFRHEAAALIRVSPLVSPVMHPVHVTIHHWYVPNRIIWDGWEDFITSNDASGVLPTVVIPATGNAWELAKAFGVGTYTAAATLNALPFRAYNKIWNEFYRDQDLDTPAVQRTGDTGDIPADFQPFFARWQKDYFTTARPYPQQGQDTSVALLDLNLGTAPISGLYSTDGVPTSVSPIPPQTGTPPASDVRRIGYRATNPTNNPFVDLSALSGSANMDINEWRKAMAYQRIREHRNRFGSRYRDYLAFLGVRASDQRLDRPEYLGGGRQTISFSEVLSTAATSEGGLGDLGGHGIAAIRTRPYRRFFEEHGWVLSFICARPKAIYMNTLPRKFLRRRWDDFWQKELEMMGEQPISNGELYADSGTFADVFGWTPRYDDYRHEQSFVSGEFRDTLDYWHLARKFTSQPALNPTFLACNPTNRIFADTNTDQFQAMISHRISARRLVSKRARS